MTMHANLVESATLGECRIELVRVVDGSDERWLLFFRTPTGPRIELLSRVLRKIGGHFGGAGDQLGIVYDGQHDAHAAFGLLLETVVREAGGALGAVLRPERDRNRAN